MLNNLRQLIAVDVEKLKAPLRFRFNEMITANDFCQKQGCLMKDAEPFLSPRCPQLSRGRGARSDAYTPSSAAVAPARAFILFVIKRLAVYGIAATQRSEEHTSELQSQ